VNVTTQFGVIHGLSSSNPAYRWFRGIPFANAPVGNLRFAEPVDWTAQYPAAGLNATNWGNSCIGAGSGTVESEDCLFLNVITPLNATTSSAYPVMFWIYGGAFVEGSSTLYDGRPLSYQNNIVYVSVNYRLSSFGWICLQDALDNGESCGNYGLLDQQSGLRWVKNNIKAFGGDPTRVMIFGESAGGISTNLQLVLTGGTGLFHAALIESGFPVVRDLPFAINEGIQIAKAANCTGTGIRACLRTKTVKQIQNAQSGENGDAFTTAGFGPVQDGRAIAGFPFTLLEQGKWSKVPVLAGTNTDEGTMFVYPDYPGNTFNDATYKQFIYNALNSHQSNPWNTSFMNQVYQQYPPSGSNNSDTNKATASALIADYSFVCGTRHFLRLIGPTTTEKQYLYHFDHTPCSPVPNWGVYHSSEIDFVYDTPSGCAVKFSPADETFAKQLGTWWSNMATSGNPNTPKTSTQNWPTYDATGDQDLYLNNQFKVETGRRKSYCDFWDSVGLYNPPP
jgi:para-nitrobenzyl esterase